MGRDVVFHTVSRLRGSMLGWGVGLGLYALLITAVFPSVEGNEAVSEFVDQMPDVMYQLFGGGDLTTVAGFFRVEFFSYLPLLLAIFTIGKATSLTVGEEEEGLLDLVLAQPVARWRVIGGRFVGVAWGVFVAASFIAVAFLVAGAGVGLAWRDMAGLALWAYLAGVLALLFGAVALAVCGVSHRRRAGVVAGTVAAVGSFLLNGLAPLADWLEPFQGVSPYHWFMETSPVEGQVHVAGFVGLVVVTVALVLVGMWGYERKDLDV